MPAVPKPSARAPAVHTPAAPPWSDEELAALERALDALPAPLSPLSLDMLDGYLVGVLLQPRAVPEAQWWPFVLDEEGRSPPARLALDELRTRVLRRRDQLNAAIHQRQWFDPWVFELDDADDPLEAILPWVAGFSLAMAEFPALMDMDSPELLEPLAVLYRALDPEDLEDADDLLEAIEELEPPADLDEAVESLVTSTLLLADVSRPQSPVPRGAPRGMARRPAPGGRRGPARPPHRGGPGIKR